MAKAVARLWIDFRIRFIFPEKIHVCTPNLQEEKESIKQRWFFRRREWFLENSKTKLLLEVSFTDEKSIFYYFYLHFVFTFSPFLCLHIIYKKDIHMTYIHMHGLFGDDIITRHRGQKRSHRVCFFSSSPRSGFLPLSELWPPTPPHPAVTRHDTCQGARIGREYCLKGQSDCDQQPKDLSLSFHSML